MIDNESGPRVSLGPPGQNEIYLPDHYCWIPGIECKDVVKHFPFMEGNAIKYIWRAGKKGDKLKDLLKARECLDNVIRDLESQCDCGQNHPRVKIHNQWLCTSCGRPDAK